MRFGIYVSNFSKLNLDAIHHVTTCLKKAKLSYSFHETFRSHVKLKPESYFRDMSGLVKTCDLLVTLGGDGTILNAVRYVYGSRIPMVGVNTGRLGYLTSFSPEEFGKSLKEIMAGNYQVDQRAMLEIETSMKVKAKVGLALNEISVLKKDSSSMIAIHARLDGEFLNTYWADGLIIATATGSTAYSLSCGGPILAPTAGNFIITPIAAHNLNVRPLVIPDSSVIELTFEARSADILLSMDSSSRIIDDKVSIEVRKAPHKIHLLRSGSYSYLKTLRSKLNWGLDQRN